VRGYHIVGGEMGGIDGRNWKVRRYNYWRRYDEDGIQSVTGMGCGMGWMSKACTMEYEWCTMEYEWCTIEGYECTIEGYECTIEGYECTIEGYECTIEGYECTIEGYECTVGGV
jgi:hypothetical protein